MNNASKEQNYESPWDVSWRSEKCVNRSQEPCRTDSKISNMESDIIADIAAAKKMIINQVIVPTVMVIHLRMSGHVVWYLP